MASTGLRVTGGRELRRALRTATGDLDDLKAAHRQVAAIVAAAAQSAAPKRTGKLAGTIRPNAGQRYARVSVGNNRSSANGVRYAGPIHYGWPTGSPSLPKKVRNFTGREWFITPRPFVIDVAQGLEPLWTRVYLDAIDEIISKIGETADGNGP